jgi:cbb3-type cytochrome oxidase maturation protein
MQVIFLMIGVSVLIALGFLAAFFWSVKNGQFEDIYSPSIRILYDDNNMQEPVKENELKEIEKSKSNKYEPSNRKI